MQFLNWGHESPEQKAARDKWEAELYEAMLIQKAMSMMTPTGGGLVTKKTGETIIVGYYDDSANPTWRIRTYNFSTSKLADEINTGLSYNAGWGLIDLAQTDYHKGFTVSFSNPDTIEGQIRCIDCDGVQQGIISWTETDVVDYNITSGSGWIYVLVNSTVYFFDGINFSSHTWESALNLGISGHDSTFSTSGMLNVTDSIGDFTRRWIFYGDKITTIDVSSIDAWSPNKNAFVNIDNFGNWQLGDSTGMIIHSNPSGDLGSWVKFYGDTYLNINQYSIIDSDSSNYTIDYYNVKTNKLIQKTLGPFAGNTSFLRYSSNDLGNYDYPSSSTVTNNNSAIATFQVQGIGSGFFNGQLAKMESITICPFIEGMPNSYETAITASDFGQVNFGIASTDDRILFGKDSIVMPFTTNGTTNLSLLVLGKTSSKVIDLLTIPVFADSFNFETLQIITTGDYLILRDDFTIVLINEFGLIVDINRSQDNAISLYTNYNTIVTWDNVSIKYKNETSNQFIELIDQPYQFATSDSRLIFRPTGKRSGTIAVRTSSDDYFRIISTNSISQPILIPEILAPTFSRFTTFDDCVIAEFRDIPAATIIKYDLSGNIIFRSDYSIANNKIIGKDFKYYGDIFNYPTTDINVISNEGESIRFPDATSTIQSSNINDVMLLD